MVDKREDVVDSGVEILGDGEGVMGGEVDVAVGADEELEVMGAESVDVVVVMVTGTDVGKVALGIETFGPVIGMGSVISEELELVAAIGCLMPWIVNFGLAFPESPNTTTM